MLLVDLPEGLVVVLEEPLPQHLVRVLLRQVTQNLGSVADPHMLRLLESVHEGVLVGLKRLLKAVSVLDLAVLVVKLDAPRDAVFFGCQSEDRIELDADWKVPAELFPIEREPHLVVAVDLVFGSVSIKHSLHL